MIFLVLILVFTVIALLDVPGFVRGKYWRDLGVFLFFYFLSFTLLFLYFMDVAIPSPIKGVIFIFRDVLHLSYEPG